jgi:hypothetical protein
MLVNKSGRTAKSNSRQHLVIGDIPVVYEQPVAVAKRVTVGLLHRCSGSGAHMSEEQRATNFGGELEQILVAPRRGDAAKYRRLGATVILAQAGTVAVGNCHVGRMPTALLD